MTTLKSNSRVLPILMGMTTPTAIQEADQVTIIYDEVHQIVYDSRTVGTKSLKSHFTLAKGRVGTGKTDKKNEIDDSKTVK